MLKQILFVLFSFLSVASFGQRAAILKVKIKKDQLLINDTIVGNWESVGKFLRAHQYHYKSLDNKPIVSVEDASTTCLFKDSTYTFSRIIFHESNKVVFVEESELKASVNIETTVAKFLVNRWRVLGENGKIDPVAFARFLKNNPDTSVPNEVRIALDYQTKMSEDIGYVEPRNTQKPIVVEDGNDCLKVKENYHLNRCYTILQDKTFIGHVRVSSKDPSTPGNTDSKSSIRVDFFNAKDARIAVYKDFSFPVFMVYKTDIKYDFMKNPFRKYQDSELKLITEISYFLSDKKYW